MSWTDYFPVLDEVQISTYEQLASSAEKSELAEWLEVASRANERPARHRVAVSLFWKNSWAEEDELPVTGREQMQNASELGLLSRYAPWQHYVEPLLKGAILLAKARPEVVLRVYLASDLEFLVEDLVSVGCEVFLMRTPSVRHNPGAMWRFLALENPDEWVTVIDADRGVDILTDVERTEQAMAAGLGLWRMPYYFRTTSGENDVGNYRPINACQFGAKGGQPMQVLIKAFIWHNRRGTMPNTWQEIVNRGDEPHAFSTTTWPSYGFDEWFLQAALYPRLAFEGVLTFVHWSRPALSFCHVLDVEYVTWANPRSEVFRCPRPLVVGTPPWERGAPKPALVVREETTVVVRERQKLGPAQEILRQAPAKEILGFQVFQGSIGELLIWVRENVSLPYWVDLNPRLKFGERGSELFCDRRYADADVVVCGHSFSLISPEIGAWAERHGLEGRQWKEGGILKIPKLEGPMTFWRTAFSSSFQREWIDSTNLLEPGILLQAWIEQGRANVFTTSAKRMGWSVR